MSDRHEHLKALGESAAANSKSYNYDRPDPSLLETFESPSGDKPMMLEIEVPEFTSLCPMTGQPDFATIRISYVPKGLCIESKSLKLYLMGFRNFGEFHEACVARIHEDLEHVLDGPVWLQVRGEFAPRGGIPFWPTIAAGAVPAELEHLVL